MPLLPNHNAYQACRSKVLKSSRSTSSIRKFVDRSAQHFVCAYSCAPSVCGEFRTVPHNSDFNRPISSQVRGGCSPKIQHTGHHLKWLGAIVWRHFNGEKKVVLLLSGSYTPVHAAILLIGEPFAGISQTGYLAGMPEERPYSLATGLSSLPLIW